MTKSSAAPCPDVGEMFHSLLRPTRRTEQQSRAVALPAAPPELVVTCEPGVARSRQKVDYRITSAHNCGSQADEESLCSDSGFGGSPAPSLGLRKLSDCSSVGLSPSSSFEEYEEEIRGTNEEKITSTRNHEEKNKTMVNWSPVVVPLKKRAPWVQVVGHAGNFQVDSDGKLLKKYCASEQRCLQQLMNDVLRPFVPEYYGVTRRDEQGYNLMEDLLFFFDSPCIMDCKMGSRTYLEEELRKARKHPQPRKDMFEKMVAVDPDAPTLEEKDQQAVLKTRYMQWRETLSSTATLGFRIEGFKKSDGTCNTNFKRTKYKEEVMEVLNHFVDSNLALMQSYQQRLKELRLILEKSDFFKKHEMKECYPGEIIYVGSKNMCIRLIGNSKLPVCVALRCVPSAFRPICARGKATADPRDPEFGNKQVVGSSLLFVHDQSTRSGVWMIDFGKTVPMPPPLTLDHRSPWAEGNREDGYLWGLDNFITILTDMLSVT